MANKSAHALDFTLQRLGEGRKGLYLWTFTLPDTCSVQAACSKWRNLCRDLVRQVGMRGVRVYEMHPSGHGLHVHVVCLKWHDVNVVREYAGMHGWGRINVTVISVSSLSYVSKYLRKSKRSGYLKGIRIWDCLGKIKEFRTRVKDIEINTSFTRLLKSIKTMTISAMFPHVSLNDYKAINWYRYLTAMALYWSGNYGEALGHKKYYVYPAIPAVN